MVGDLVVQRENADLIDNAVEVGEEGVEDEANEEEQKDNPTNGTNGGGKKI